MRCAIALPFVLSLSLSAASVDGLNIHSSITGKGSKTVILVHGYTCDESTWTEQTPALAKEYRVVTLDLPGHGKSDSPKDGKFSMDLFARAIEAVREEAKVDRVVLVGHSMGTPVVLRYAHLYPAHTSALVFVDGLMPAVAPSPASNLGAGMGGPNGRAAREAMIRGFFVADTTPAVQTKVLNMMLGAPEATAKTQSLNTASSLTKITERVRSQRTSGSTNRIRTLNRLVNGRPQLAGLSAYPDFGFSVGAAIYNRNLR